MSSLDVLEFMECIECGSRFSPEDVRKFGFFPSTGICFNCYQTGQTYSYRTWCFGKPLVRSEKGRVLEYGYNPNAQDCSVNCHDRKICALFVSGELPAWRAAKIGTDEETMKKIVAEKNEVVCPFRQSQSMTSKAWMMCTKGIRIPDLVSWVKRQGGEPRRVLRIMRSGQYLDVRWSVDEQNEFLKITYRGGGVGGK